MASIPCEAGDIFYIDLENEPRRIQCRIAALFHGECARPDLNRLQWMASAPELNAGSTDRLDEWRQSVAEPKLVVIDVLQRVKPAGIGARDAYENDYSVWAHLGH